MCSKSCSNGVHAICYGVASRLDYSLLCYQQVSTKMAHGSSWGRLLYESGTMSSCSVSMQGERSFHAAGGV